jgi:MFS family permease
VARSRAFLTLVVAFSGAAFATFAVVVNLVALLAERGVGPGTAAIALGLGGAGQVAGRLSYATLTRAGVRTRTALILLAMATTTALLGVLTCAPALIAAAILAGTARGVFTLLQATAVTDRWGPAHYGHLTGLLSAPLTITMALAPFAGAALAELVSGYTTAFLILATITTGAALLSLASTPTLAPKEHS